jgi:hypothetical protein
LKTNTPLSIIKIKDNGFNLKPHPVKLQKISNKKYILTGVDLQSVPKQYLFYSAAAQIFRVAST